MKLSDANSEYTKTTIYSQDNNVCDLGINRDKTKLIVSGYYHDDKAYQININKNYITYSNTGSIVLKFNSPDNINIALMYDNFKEKGNYLSIPIGNKSETISIQNGTCICLNRFTHAFSQMKNLQLEQELLIDNDMLNELAILKNNCPTISEYKNDIMYILVKSLYAMQNQNYDLTDVFTKISCDDVHIINLIENMLIYMPNVIINLLKRFSQINLMPNVIINLLEKFSQRDLTTFPENHRHYGGQIQEFYKEYIKTQKQEREKSESPNTKKSSRLYNYV